MILFFVGVEGSYELNGVFGCVFGLELLFDVLLLCSLGFMNLFGGLKYGFYLVGRLMLLRKFVNF